MTIFERNMEVLKAVRNDLYEGLKDDQNPEEQVLVGDALDGEKFLAVLRGENIVPLNSTYHPSHEADRYVLQFEHESEESALLLFGFSNGMVVEHILSEECSVRRCIVYEPSRAIFLKALEEYDLTEVLSNPQLKLFIEGINGEQLERFLDEVINYRSWRFFSFKKLTQYKELFPEQCRRVFEVFHRIFDNKRADMNTLIGFARCSLVNEIKSLKWIMDCRTLGGVVGKFPVDMPCIIVAAGPSLEKNVEVLKQAKGRAFIICVDTAIPFLLKHGIIPDMVCTVDASKGTWHFEGSELHNLPIAISTDSNYRVLEYIGEVNPFYMSITNDYYKNLFHEKGESIGYFDGGGSVATVCFQMCVEIGFRTIIIIGQDLAYTDRKAHAGKGELKSEDLIFKVLMVEGYDGNKVMTRGDYKTYIDWYNLRIPELSDRTIVNATEGGAKLNGAIQMTLQEAVNTYCRDTYDISAILEQVPKVWVTKEEKAELYYELKKKWQYFKGFRRRLKNGVEETERAVRLLTRKNYHPKELKVIDKKLDTITKEVEETEGMVILVKRMIETDITLTDDLNDAEEDLELESIRLYEKMRKYLQDLLEAVEELLPIWNEVLQEINDKYQFETS